MTTAICPHCGYSLDRDDVIDRDGFCLDPRGTASYRGKRLAIQASHVTILHSLAAAKGRPLSHMALAERIGCESDDFGDVIRTHISRLRSHLREQGCSVPVATVWGEGFAWRPAA